MTKEKVTSNQRTPNLCLPGRERRQVVSEKRQDPHGCLAAHVRRAEVRFVGEALSGWSNFADCVCPSLIFPILALRRVRGLRTTSFYRGQAEVAPSSLDDGAGDS